MQDLNVKEPTMNVPQQGKLPGERRRVVFALLLCSTCAVFSHMAAAQTAKAPDVDNPAQTTSPAPVESTPVGPMNPPAAPPVVDNATESSPTTPPAHGVYIAPHTEIDVHLQRAIDSASIHNGDMIPATLTAPVKVSNGKTLPAGTRVGVTAVAVAPAGKISSRGEITLQVTHVGPVGVLTDVLTFHGQEGHKDLPDSAPAKGTEASVNAGTKLKFHVPVIPK